MIADLEKEGFNPREIGPLVVAAAAVYLADLAAATAAAVAPCVVANLLGFYSRFSQRVLLCTQERARVRMGMPCCGG